MFTAARASGPKTRKAGALTPASHNFVHNSVHEDSEVAGEAQCSSSIPRIIDTHWFRAETMEVAHG